MKIGNFNNQSQIPPKKQEEKKLHDSPEDKVELGSVPLGEHKKWLFMNYIAADCNLIQYQVGNVNNQELVGSDKNTHIVDMIDMGHDADPDQEMHKWSGCKTFYITQDKDLREINSPMVEFHGNAFDMSNPKNLTKFIVDTMKKFPSDHVALILNDHGGGFTGALADDSDGDFMSLPKIGKALADAEEITGKKIDIVGFDACLMAETEVAHELKDNAKILLASEESEGGPGWTYNEMLDKSKVLNSALGQLQESLKQRIDVSPEEFAKIVVKGNEDYQQYIPTFSATDLTRMDSLTQATNEFAKAIIASDEKAAIKDAISGSENYGGGYEPYSNLHDLHHLADLVSKGVLDPKLKESAEGVKKALGEAVIANESDPVKYPNSKGLSIYAPVDAGSGMGYKYNATRFAKESQWDEAMVEIGKVGKQEGEVKSVPPEIPDVWPDGSSRKS